MNEAGLQLISPLVYQGQSRLIWLEWLSKVLGRGLSSPTSLDLLSGDARNWMWDLLHAKQMLHHRAIAPPPNRWYLYSPVPELVPCKKGSGFIGVQLQEDLNYVQRKEHPLCIRDKWIFLIQSYEDCIDKNDYIIHPNKSPAGEWERFG